MSSQTTPLWMVVVTEQLHLYDTENLYVLLQSPHIVQYLREHPRRPLPGPADRSLRYIVQRHHHHHHHLQLHLHLYYLHLCPHLHLHPCFISIPAPTPIFTLQTPINQNPDSVHFTMKPRRWSFSCHSVVQLVCVLPSNVPLKRVDTKHSYCFYCTSNNVSHTTTTRC